MVTGARGGVVGRTRLAALSGVVALAATVAVAGQKGMARPDEGAAVQSQAAHGFDVPPKIIHLEQPKYPPRARECGDECTVLVEILIDERGRVARAKVLESVPELDEAALACVKTWRFRPAQKDGKPVAAIAHAPVNFRRYHG